jgi:hypothetical protein
MPELKNTIPLTGDAAARELHRLTRRSFTTGAVAALVGLGGWAWLKNANLEDGVPWPLRRVLRFNQRLAATLLPPRHLAPIYPAERVRGEARTNGFVGLSDSLPSCAWQLRIQHEDRAGEQAIALRSVPTVQRAELVTELKCVERWSQVMQFGGVRFRDFMTQFGLGTRSGRAPDPENQPQDLYRYVYLATPGEDYYVGLDMASALHAQTLLCDTMNWEPLSPAHEAPLRLYLAVKYGFKSLKRVGLIRFQDERPPDYWADRGYDWYAGL